MKKKKGFKNFSLNHVFIKFCINAVDEKLKKQFDRQIPWAPTFSVNLFRMI